MFGQTVDMLQHLLTVDEKNWEERDREGEREGGRERGRGRVRGEGERGREGEREKGRERKGEREGEREREMERERERESEREREREGERERGGGENWHYAYHLGHYESFGGGKVKTEKPYSFASNYFVMVAIHLTHTRRSLLDLVACMRFRTISKYLLSFPLPLL